MIEQVPDHIMNPEAARPEMPVAQVQAAGELAAAHTVDSVPAQTTHREGYWKQPTQEQTDRAADYGFDLNKQSKY
jgi:hypothetical protein